MPGDAPIDQLDLFASLTPRLGEADAFGNHIRALAGARAGEPIRTLSLFTGAGGLDIGFHDAGFHVETMVEIDARFTQSLERNSGEGRYFGEPKPEIRTEDIRDHHPEHGKRVDFIIGGPPCQTFSAAGRRAAGVRGTEDARGTLFEEYVRLVTTLRPRGFLFENVYGITGANGGEAWAGIQRAFAEAGYEIAHRVLDAADYGVPQRRERLFIVGIRKGQGIEYRFPRPTHGPDSPDQRPALAAADAVRGAPAGGEPPRGALGGRFGHLLAEIPPGLNYSFFTERMGHPRPVFAWRSKFSDFLYKADPEVPVRTLKAQGGQYTGPFHWADRAFSVAELKRLQTIPDGYEIVGGRQVAIHQVGNSVPPQLARILALSILDQLFGVAPPIPLPTLAPDEKLGFRTRKSKLTKIYRAKAEAAIAALTNEDESATTRERSYSALLTEGFGWRESQRGKGGLHVRARAGKQRWTIKLTEKAASEPTLAPESGFAITVLPAGDGAWAIPAPEVELSSGAVRGDLFTGAWKAFESEIVRRGLKADLVQLCGYYQYPPAIRARIEFGAGAPPAAEWAVVASVVAGEGVGEILAEADLAAAWGVPEADLDRHARFLRDLGYEVRNRNTNPQIPGGHLLVPYAFPTLTPVSVQLRKSL